MLFLRSLLTSGLLLLCALSQAAYAAADVQLTWNANTEVDLSHYRLHRGNTSDFTPTADNLVADSLTGTSTVETAVPAGTWHYRMVAIDLSGNVSPPSTAAALTILGDVRTIIFHISPAPAADSIMIDVDPTGDSVNVDATGRATITGLDPTTDTTCAPNRVLAENS